MSDDMTCTHTYAREADGRCPACGAPPPSPAPAPDDVVAELRRLYEAATPGPWDVWAGGAFVFAGKFDPARVDDDHHRYVEASPVTQAMGRNDRANAAFIAAAYNAMPALLDVVEAATPIVEHLRRQLERVPLMFGDREAETRAFVDAWAALARLRAGGGR